MPTAFDQLTVQEAKKLLAEASAPIDTLISTGTYQDASTQQIVTRNAPAVNLAYYRGDHWQGGCEWAGPQPSGASTDVQAAINEIRKAFVSKNAIKEAVDRHMRAVIGGEPIWSFTVARPLGKVPKPKPTPQQPPAVPEPPVSGTQAPPQPAQPTAEPEMVVDEQPTPQEQALIDECDALIEWWDEHVLKKLQDAVTTLLPTGKATLRIWIPKRFNESGMVSAKDLKDALERIYIQAPEYAQAGVYTDEDSQERIGIYQSKETIEVCYLDETNQTIIGQSIKNGTMQLYEPMDLGGRLLIYQMECSPLITEQVRSQQRLLNMAITMLSRNVILAGFLERIIINAQMPGRKIDDPDNPGEKIFLPEPLDVGPGSVNVLKGLAYTDDDGKTTIASPSVVFRDPVSVDTFTNTRDAAYRGILEETAQLYSLTSGQYAISADSRREARYDFITSLRDTVTQVESAGRWLLETTLALAALLSGTPGKYNGLRAVFECRVDTGPIDASERDAIMKEVDTKLESREGAMVRLGRTDPDATLQQIASEQEKLQTPVEAVQTDRARLGLQQDQQQASGVRDRLRQALERDEQEVRV